MDDMELVEVPDTPDRIISRNENDNNLSPLAGLVDIQDSAEHCSHHWRRDMGKGRQEIEMGQKRRPAIRPPKRIGLAHESGNFSRPIIISPSDNSSTTHSLRRLKIGGSCDNEQRSIFGAIGTDGNEATTSGYSYKLSDSSENVAAINLMGGVAINSHCCPKSDQVVDRFCRAEENANGKTCDASFSSMICEKGLDKSNVSVDECPKKIPQPSSIVSSPSPTRRKRLVRNGCISPLNIASRTRELEVGDGSSNTILSQMGNVASSGMPSGTQLNEIVAEEENRARIKGKGVLLHPCTSKEHERNLLNASTRNPTARSVEESVGTGNADPGVSACESEGGWRSTRNQPRGFRAGKDANQRGHVSQRISHPHQSSSNKYNFAANKGFFPGSSRHMPDDNRVSGQQHSANAPANNRNHISRDGAKSSMLGSEDSEVVIMGSSEQSRDSSSSLNHGRKRSLDTVIEINDSSPEVRYSQPRIPDPIVSPDTDAKARQVEADEMLARELQEQLYNESLQVDNVAQRQRQVEQHASSAAGFSIRSSVHRGSRATHSSRQLPLRSSRSSARGRGRSTNVNTRIQRPRRGSFRRSSMLLSGDSGFHFPLDMDVDMRMDMLEALEASMADLDDVPTLTNGLFRMERDFNENDYEMLLALDENVRHAGTSSTQVNNLPESKVQTDISDEACAICLENPKRGETIRHLPCLHKFHKDCIDPWLTRSTACPVCKQSVT